MKSFPKLSEQEMRERLQPPTGRVRVVIDTDAKNEIDDQFALAWALFSQDKLEIEGVYAAPFSFQMFAAALIRAYDLQRKQAITEEADDRLVERFHGLLIDLARRGVDPKDIHFDGPDVGMERSYDEILTVYQKLGMDPSGRVFRGSSAYLPAPDQPVDSPAARHLIERALAADERPLYVAAIGAVTNIASAILLEPEIIRHIVVLWTAGYPTWFDRPNTDSFNLIQDVPASQLLFDCGVPQVYLPGFHVGAQLRISLPEMERWVHGQGEIGDYLYWLYTHNPIQQRLGIDDQFGRTWIIWDLINIAWLLNPDWVPSDLWPAAALDAETRWQRGLPDRHLLREAYGIDRDAIFRDLFTKLRAGCKLRMTTYRSIMEITAAEWLQALEMPARDVPDVVIVEGTWWRAQRTDWRLSYLEDVRELTFPDIFWGRWRGKKVVYCCAYGAPRTVEVIHLFGVLGARLAVQIGTCGGLQPQLRPGDIVLPTSAACHDGVAHLYAGQTAALASQPWVSAAQQQLRAARPCDPYRRALDLVRALCPER